MCFSRIYTPCLGQSRKLRSQPAQHAHSCLKGSPKVLSTELAITITITFSLLASTRFVPYDGCWTSTCCSEDNHLFSTCLASSMNLILCYSFPQIPLNSWILILVKPGSHDLLVNEKSLLFYNLSIISSISSFVTSKVEKKTHKGFSKFIMCARIRKTLFFCTTNINITIARGGQELLKQTSLWRVSFSTIWQNHHKILGWAAHSCLYSFGWWCHLHPPVYQVMQLQCRKHWLTTQWDLHLKKISISSWVQHHKCLLICIVLKFFSIT